MTRRRGGLDAQQFYVYILTNRSRTLYIGVTNDLERRVAQHADGQASEFARKYRINQLGYYEITSNIDAALARERHLKGWKRARKLALIESMNPDWRDLRSHDPVADQ
jgi:putative endonuclease